LIYEWDFGDKTRAPGKDATHIYPQDGQYLVRLTVTDDHLARRVAETLIRVGDIAPDVAITSPGDATSFWRDKPSHCCRGKGPGGTGDSRRTNLLACHTARRAAAAGTGRRQWFNRQLCHAGHDTGWRLCRGAVQGQQCGWDGGRDAHRPVSPSQDGYIRTWWISKGFPFGTLDDDHLPGGEASYIVKPGDPLFRLVRSSSQSHKVTLLDYITPGVHTVAYAFVWVDVPEDRKGLLGMMSDDGIAVWLNGKNIWHNKISRFMPDDTRDIDLPPIELHQGLNSLLVKVDQNDGDWAFKVRVLYPDGSIMWDATVKTTAE